MDQTQLKRELVNQEVEQNNNIEVETQNQKAEKHRKEHQKKHMEYDL